MAASATRALPALMDPEKIVFELPDSYWDLSGSSRLVHISCVHSGSVSAILCCSSYSSTLIARCSCSVRDGGGVMSSRGYVA